MAIQPTKKPRDDIKKDTIYIDIDDEITAIIEKLQNAPERIVALVLPKRASVMQSVVNMKLLKRSAENAKKHIVLITSEAGLLPLAGMVGLHVAPTLQSKPAIPVAPNTLGQEHVIDEETGEEFDDFNAGSVADAPIGTLAGAAASGVAAAANGTSATSAGAGLGAPASTAYGARAAGLGAAATSEPETIELGDDDDDDATFGAEPAVGSGAGAKAGATAVAGMAATKVAKKGTNKKLKVPNFNRFRMVLVIGLLLLLVVVGGFFYANGALAKATISITTNSSDIATKANLTLDPKATELDLESNTVPAKVETKTQSGSQQVSTSGQKNNGDRATGTAIFYNCDKNDRLFAQNQSIPAGTGVSSGGKTYITQTTATVPPSSYKPDGTCRSDAPSSSVAIKAQTPGTSYNSDSLTFAVAYSNPGDQTNSFSATGSAADGTDNVVKTVTQADIDSAKAKIATADSTGIKDDLTKKLQADGDYALTASLKAGDPSVTPSAAVGDQADTVTVNSSTAFTMYGVKLGDIIALVKANVSKQIDSSKQQILQDGVSAAKYDIPTAVSSGPLQVGLTATSLAGPQISPEKLPLQLAGKRTGDVQSQLKAIPGVTDVSVKYSPFWVSKVPTKPSKVTIVVEKAGATK